MGGGPGREQVSIHKAQFSNANLPAHQLQKCTGPSARKCAPKIRMTILYGREMDHDVLKSVAEQMMTSGQVSVDGKSFRVSRTGTRRFRTVRFLMGGVEYQAIEQNPEKPSRWGQMARAGHRVVQFRDLLSGKYVAVVVDQKLTEYGRK